MAEVDRTSDRTRPFPDRPLGATVQQEDKGRQSSSSVPAEATHAGHILGHEKGPMVNPGAREGELPVVAEIQAEVPGTPPGPARHGARHESS